MASSQLLAHCGARLVERDELDRVPVPPGTATWFPIAHRTVLDATTATLEQAGFRITRQQLALTRSDARFFGTLDLEGSVAAGVHLAVGIRNSTDKSLPISFCAGSRVFVCDNLAFNSEVKVARKHTRFGELRFSEAISRTVATLGQFQEKERQRIASFQERQLANETAEALMLRSFEQGIVSALALPKLIEAWRKPAFPEFEPRTLWSLENCYTGVMAGLQRTNPQRFASATIRLQGFLAGAAQMGQAAEETPFGLSA